MKKGILLIILMAFLASPAIAREAIGMYVTPKIGWSHMKAGNENFPATVFSPGGSYSLQNSKNGDSAASNFVGGLSVGYNFNYLYAVPIRVEVEYMARTSLENSWSYYDTTQFANIKRSLNFRANTLMLNAFFDIDTKTDFTPYIGGGVGFAFINTKAGTNFDRNIDSISNSDSHNKSNFAWDIGAGVAYQLTDNIALDLGYRYFDFGKAEINNANSYGKNPLGGLVRLNSASSASLTAHEVTLGLRLSF